MGYNRLVVSCLFIIMHLNLIFCDTRYKKFGFMRSEMKMKENLISGKVTYPSLISCAAMCSGTKDCLVISFNALMQECLYSYKQLISGTLSDNFVQESGWTSISKKEYTVYLRRGPSGGEYTVSWSEAGGVCANENTSLASEDDLLAPRALGFGFCLCGWMSSGRSGFVLQRESPGCIPEPFHTGIFYCDRPRVNVYCLIKDHH